MTDKQKEAIKRLKSIDENTEEYDGNLFKADFETVLNLIQTQQAEIEQLKNKNKHQSKEIQKAVDYTFELNKEIENKDKESHFIQGKLDKSNAEIIKLKRMIDLMSEQLTTPLHSKEWVKDYYERKVETEDK